MILTIILFSPFIINILILIIYIYTNKKYFRKLFILTALTAFAILGIVFVLSSIISKFYKTVALPVFFWMFSGYLMTLAVCIKILIFTRLHKRYQDPQNYHLNYFGKKVIHSGFMTKKEMVIFFMSIPVFLFAGAFFIARLINMIIYDWK
jgi:hypothetical protein